MPVNKTKQQANMPVNMALHKINSKQLSTMRIVTRATKQSIISVYDFEEDRVYIFDLPDVYTRILHNKIVQVVSMDRNRIAISSYKLWEHIVWTVTILQIDKHTLFDSISMSSICFAASCHSTLVLVRIVPAAVVAVSSAWEKVSYETLQQSKIDPAALPHLTHPVALSLSSFVLWCQVRLPCQSF